MMMEEEARKSSVSAGFCALRALMIKRRLEWLVVHLKTLTHELGAMLTLAKACATTRACHVRGVVSPHFIKR
jgi:hypothetical protein